MKKGKSILDAPSDVLEVWVLQSLNQPVGLSTYERMKATIKKYPEYFPWETLYNSIPDEVHNAYRKEVDPTWGEPIDWEKYRNVKESPPIVLKPYEGGDIAKMFDELFEAENKRRDEELAERKRRMKIWKKHYSKYGLDYRD